ncbi:hypothetical protein AWB67_05808 [Caballeronia terrestris]|jgi:hypothetical protein|uniref:Uncharacterized protein n=1 Tax=Caballeronia terrestris TaxID=1226301 RepID=A0A158KJH3_9BURK|nr:hypothetical protein AWB67_05808 [Caballeronia terrestris]
MWRQRKLLMLEPASSKQRFIVSSLIENEDTSPLAPPLVALDKNRPCAIDRRIEAGHCYEITAIDAIDAYDALVAAAAASETPRSDVNGLMRPLMRHSSSFIGKALDTRLQLGRRERSALLQA